MQAALKKGAMQPAGLHRRSLRCSASISAAAPCPSLVRKAQLCSQVAAIWRQSSESQKQDVQYLKQRLSGVNWMGAIALPLAATTATGGMGGQGELYGAVAKALDIYLVILTVRVLMSWFKNISWTNEPWSTLRQFTDPYLNIFRGIIPPLGGMDLSPMLGFFLLQFIRNQVYRMSLYASV